MVAFPIPSDEAERLHQLDAYAVLDTAPEPCFDAVAEAAARLFDAPIALLSIIDRDRQWLKARWGLDVACTPRDQSFCTHAIAARAPLVVPDATLDPRFAHNPLVSGEPGVRFYAGLPVVNDRGVALGALCVIDRHPRPGADAGALAALARLAGTVAAMLDRRRDLLVREAVSGFAESTAMALVTTDAAGRITFWNPAAEAMFGHSDAQAIGRNIRLIVPDRFRVDHDRGLERVRAGGAPRLAGKAVEVVGLRRDGTEFPIEISLSSWRGRAGVEFGAQIQDISARRARDLELAHLAAHDPLTGLANRRTFSQALAAVVDAGRPAAVLSLDLDGFKLVNDTLGHAVGDGLSG